MKKTFAFGLAHVARAAGADAVPVPHWPASGSGARGGWPHRSGFRSPPAAPVTYRLTSATQPTQAIDASLLAAVEAEPDPDRKSEALERIVQSVSDADLPAALDALASDPSPAAADLRQLLVRRWAESDAPAAAAWTAQLPEGSSAPCRPRTGRHRLGQCRFARGHRMGSGYARGREQADRGARPWLRSRAQRAGHRFGRGRRFAAWAAA